MERKRMEDIKDIPKSVSAHRWEGDPKRRTRRPVGGLLPHPRPLALPPFPSAQRSLRCPPPLQPQLKEFAINSKRLLAKCTKPDRKGARRAPLRHAFV